MGKGHLKIPETPAYGQGGVSFDDVSVGQDLPPLTKTVSTRQLVMYAGASGDFVPIHYDKDKAASAGHHKVIVHGALKSAFLAQMIGEWVGENGSLREMSVSYRGIDYADDPLTCRGRVTEKRLVDGVGLVTMDISIENSKAEVMTKGVALVALLGRGQRS